MTHRSRKGSPSEPEIASIGFRRTSAAAATLLLLLFSSSTLQAQSAQGLELSGGYFQWGGGEVEGFDGGFRFQGTALLPPFGAYNLGFRALYGWEGVEDQDDLEITELGLGVIGRRTFGSSEGTRPFVEVTAGWSRLQVGNDGDIPIEEQNGLSAGPRVGVMFPVGGLTLSFAGEATYNAYGDRRVVQGLPTGTSGDNGWHYGVTLGFFMAN